jgi:hypothetical protein
MTFPCSYVPVLYSLIWEVPDSYMVHVRCTCVPYLIRSSRMSSMRSPYCTSPKGVYRYFIEGGGLIGGSIGRR